MDERADAEPQRAARLRGLLIGWLLDARPSGWSTSADVHDAQALEQLAELGYATGGAGPDVLFEADCDCPWCERFE